MSRQHALKAVPLQAQQSHGRTHRAYTVAQLCVVLELPRSTFFHLRRKGELPFLEELRPRLGRVIRYRAELVDRYLAGEWNRPRAFRSHGRDSRASSASTVRPVLGQ